MSKRSKVDRRYFIKTLGSAGAFSFTLPACAAGPPPGGSGFPAGASGSGKDASCPGAGAPFGAPSTASVRASGRAFDTPFPVVDHEVDLCVVGGGMAGLCAAVAAARHGARVVLMHDRPVLGGNASSEIRMHICGAHGEENRETGIIEEIFLENCRRNPGLKYTIWDTVLYEKARFQEGLTLLLNCSCNDVSAKGGRIESVRGWQTTSQTWHRVGARLFADCSGDSVLRVCGADYRRGRESRREFGESHAPVKADDKTMGNSILIQLREVDEHIPFVPPWWAITFTGDDVPKRSLRPAGNFWWLEIGGEQDTIADAEEIRDELLRIAFGVWAWIKNHPDGRGHGWELEWIGALPGKRENVRYVGDHILTQNDVEAEGRFDDIVGYGGWSMDDHHPAGIRHPGAPTIFHPAPSPYGIPLRCLYSRNVENLFFAGRNISATHMALSSTRVMATCAVLGQAVGSAAALAARHGLTPRGVWEKRLPELQELLMDDDCWLPGKKRPLPEITRGAKLIASSGDAEPLRNGLDRSLKEAENGWWARPTSWAAADAFVEYRFDKPRKLSRVRLVFDSYLPFNKRMPSSFPKKGNLAPFPKRLCRDFDILVDGGDGSWRVVLTVRDNHQRLVRKPIDVTARGVRFVPRKSWGWHEVYLFAFEVS
jgi:hypothetical protein